MSKLMAEEAGARMFEMASSLGRMHVSTLKGMADATAKTPFGPVFAINATVARMMHDSVASFGDKLLRQNADMASMEVPASPMVPVMGDPAPAMAAAIAPYVTDTATISSKPAKGGEIESIEPEAEDVLVEAAETATPDDLTLINGIGATTAKKLGNVGVTRFADISKMKEEQFADLLASLNIRSIRYSPSFWIEEAKKYETANA